MTYIFPGKPELAKALNAAAEEADKTKANGITVEFEGQVHSWGRAPYDRSGKSWLLLERRPVPKPAIRHFEGVPYP